MKMENIIFGQRKKKWIISDSDSSIDIIYGLQQISKGDIKIWTFEITKKSDTCILIGVCDIKYKHPKIDFTQLINGYGLYTRDWKIYSNKRVTPKYKYAQQAGCKYSYGGYDKYIITMIPDLSQEYGTLSYVFNEFHNEINEDNVA